MKLSHIEFMTQIRQALQEKWEKIVPGIVMDVRIDFPFFEFNRPKGLVTIITPDDQFVKVRFGGYALTTEAVPLAIACIDDGMQRLYKNNWKSLEPSVSNR